MVRMVETLTQLAEHAIVKGAGVEAPPIVKETNDPKFGDYQINGVLPLAKTLKKNPREIASQVVSALDSKGMFETPEIAGPGFINLKISSDWLGEELAKAANAPERVGVDPVTSPQKVVIDFSSPNVAKKMHVGHLRSTIIGDAISRVLTFLGHDVVRDNHIGDWGTQFGTLIWAWRNHETSLDPAEATIDVLESLYKGGTAAAKEDAEVAEACRAELAKLQAGDDENKRLWDTFIEISRREAESIYARLNVSFDTWHGESFYNDDLPGVIEGLTNANLAREDEGAMVVFFPEHRELADHPFLVRKKDGAFLYSTTDIATVSYRVESERAERVIYVVDVRQSLHFKQLFEVARRLGHTKVEFEHVGFGMMLGADGKPFKTRDGGTVTLASLLDEAESRILPKVQEKWPDVPESEQRSIASKVGVGAVKYADLAQNLATDYRFDWDKLLAAEGNTGPYLQYTLVRIRSVLRAYESKFGEVFSPSEAPVQCVDPTERALGLSLLKFSDVLDGVGRSLLPHQLCEYLYALSRFYNPFYAACPILKSEGDTLRSRMTLCFLTARTLELGLSCLNLPQLERM